MIGSEEERKRRAEARSLTRRDVRVWGWIQTITRGLPYNDPYMFNLCTHILWYLYAYVHIFVVDVCSWFMYILRTYIYDILRTIYNIRLLSLYIYIHTRDMCLVFQLWFGAKNRGTSLLCLESNNYGPKVVKFWSNFVWRNISLQGPGWECRRIWNGKTWQNMWIDVAGWWIVSGKHPTDGESKTKWTLDWKLYIFAFVPFPQFESCLW